MGITPSNFYTKLKYDLEHIEQAVDDYNRSQSIIKLLFVIFFLLGFATGFVIKAWYLWIWSSGAGNQFQSNQTQTIDWIRWQ